MSGYRHAEREWEALMQSVTKGYRGLQVLIGLNWDRLFSLAIIFAALFAGAYVIDVTHPN